MDVREKLVELLTDNLPRIGNLPKCDNPLQYTMDEIVERIADHLIANGVTFATDNNVGSKWIPVTERLPEERDSIFAKFYGTERWTEGMFLKISKDVLACVEYEDGTKAVKALHTNDGKWHLGFKQVKVTHWMPLPQPPKGE